MDSLLQQMSRYEEHEYLIIIDQTIVVQTVVPNPIQFDLAQQLTQPSCRLSTNQFQPHSLMSP